MRKVQFQVHGHPNGKVVRHDIEIHQKSAHSLDEWKTMKRSLRPLAGTDFYVSRDISDEALFDFGEALTVEFLGQNPDVSDGWPEDVPEEVRVAIAVISIHCNLLMEASEHAHH